MVDAPSAVVEHRSQAYFPDARVRRQTAKHERVDREARRLIPGGIERRTPHEFVRRAAAQPRERYQALRWCRTRAVARPRRQGADGGSERPAGIVEYPYHGVRPPGSAVAGLHSWPTCTTDHARNGPWWDRLVRPTG